MGLPPSRNAVSFDQIHSAAICPCASIGQSDSSRPFENHPPPSNTFTLEYFYAHSSIAVGFFASCGLFRCRSPPPLQDLQLTKFRNMEEKMYGRKSTYALSKKAKDIIAHRALSSFSISLSCVGNNFENFRQKCAKADLPFGIEAKGEESRPLGA